MSERGQSLPKRDVRVTSVCPSISDIILQRPERRDGPHSQYARPYRYRYAGLYNYRYAHPYRYRYMGYRYANPYRYQYARLYNYRYATPTAIGTWVTSTRTPTAISTREEVIGRSCARSIIALRSAARLC